jgi:hypothetical protein
MIHPTQDMKLPKTLINLVLKNKGRKNSVDVIDPIKTRLDFFDP